MRYVCVPKVDNEILIHGDECVTTLEELYKAIVDLNCTELHITKKFADKFFTFTALCEFVENCGTVSPNTTVTVEDTVYSDLNGAVRSLSQYKTLEELNYALTENPTKILATIQDLCKYYTETRDEANIANNKLATVVMQLEQSIREKELLHEDYRRLETMSNETMSKLQALVNRVNFRFEKTVNPDSMFVVRDNKYKHILYIKEITRVHYVDTMLYYLQEILKTLYNVPVRTVVIEPYFAYGKEALYPGYKPHWDLTYQDVYSGNILMAGFQPKLMSDILLNSNHVHYLIVLDRGCYMTPHIEGRNVSTLYTASDTADTAETISKDKLISYREDTLNIPYIENFEELSPEERIQKYSSMNVIKTLINILEEDL